MKITLIVLFIFFIIFIGYLHRLGAKREHFIRAVIETFVVYIISNLPIISLILVAFLTDKINTMVQIENNIRAIINGGEVFIYISAILAPVVWTLIAYFRDSHRALTGIYIFILFIMFPFSAFSFQQARLSETLNQNALDISALLIYGISLVLWFGAVVYTKFIEGFEPGIKSGKSVLQELEEGDV